MRVAIIGYGPIGYAVAEYLHQLRIPASIYVPDASLIQRPNNVDVKELELSKSPKLSRDDVHSLAARSKGIFGNTDYIDFCGLEIPQKGGLASCWGANLAKTSIKRRHTISEEWSDAFSFIDQLVPSFSPDITSVPGSSGCLSRHLNKKLSFYKSTLAVYSTCTQCLSCHLKCDSIWGASLQIQAGHTWLNRSVRSLYLDDSGECVVDSVDLNARNHFETYDLVILAAGAVGSFRIVKRSLNSKNIIQLHSRIKHHILTTRICFAPAFPYRKHTLSMSLFDCFVDIKDYRSYANFFPLRGALNAMFFQSALLKSGSRALSIFFPPLLQSLIRSYSEALIHFFLSRFYVVNFYHDGSFSSSYLSYESSSNKVTIYGGFRSDLEKAILKGRKSWQMVFEMLKNGILVLPSPFILHHPGADLHSYASLSADLNRADAPELLLSESILIADSSSSEYAPLENPTYYFMARSIVLLRKRLSLFHVQD